MRPSPISGRVEPVAHAGGQPGRSATEALHFSWGKGQTSFYGFTRERADHLLADVQLIQGRDPGIAEFENLVLMPRLAALYDLAGRRVEQTKATYVEPDANASETFAEKVSQYEESRAPAQVDLPGDLRIWDEPVVLMGKLHAHYGHFLTDAQARLWAFLKMRADWEEMKLVFAPVRPHELESGFIRQFHARLGLRPGRIWKAAEPTLFRRVICPLPAIQLSRRIYEGFDVPHRVVARKLLDPLKAPNRPVYLSRRGLDERHRAIVDEEKLEAALEKAGYWVVRPETLSLETQVAIFNQDQPVVGVIGSALHNALYRLGRRRQRMAILTDGAKSPRFHLVDAIKPFETSYLKCMELSPTTPATGTRLQERTYILDAEQALDFLNDAGFLESRGAARSAPSSI